MICVVCCSRNWYIHLATMLYALFKHNKVKKLYLIIEDDEIPYLKDDRIEFININKTKQYILEKSPNYKTRYTRFSLIRCYFTKLIKDDKILYIDADALVVDNIEDLWNIELGDNLLAGVHENGEWDKHLGLSGFDDKYINTGIILMNLKALRDEKIDDKMMHILNTEYHLFPDQDALNIACKGRIKYVDCRYNSTVTTGIVDDAKIIHYIRDDKGWVKGSFRSEIWYNYHIEMIGGIKMDNFKVRATRNFDDVTVQDDKGRNIKRVAGKSEWNCSKERYEYLKSHNAVELIEVEKVELPQEEVVIPLEEENIKEVVEEIVEAVEKPKKKKTSKKK